MTDDSTTRCDIEKQNRISRSLELDIARCLLEIELIYPKVFDEK